MRTEAVSFGGITWRPYALVQPAGDAAPWVTPRRNDTFAPGATFSGALGTEPKKSWVVWTGIVGRAPPDWLRNWMPG